MTSVTSTAHSKPGKNPFIVAMALGAGLFLLLQLVANRFLPGASSSSSSIMSLPSSSQRQVQRTAYEMPVDLFNDEFFASPFMVNSELVELKKAMDREVEELVGVAAPPLLRRDKETSLWKGFDIHEDDEKVQVTVSVPQSITKDDITIEVIDGTVMHIAGVRKDEKDGATSEMRFDKRFALGRNMEQDKIEAEIKNGVLTVTTPKAGKLPKKKKEVRKIPIKVELWGLLAPMKRLALVAFDCSFVYSFHLY